MMYFKKNKLGLLKEHEVTDEKLYINRRQFINKATLLAGIAALPLQALASSPGRAISKYKDLQNFLLYTFCQ